VAETAQANRINLTMAVIVILSLVGSMVFSSSASRPMMRLNSALGKCGGNLMSSSRHRPRRRNRRPAKTVT
jgi:hypothetical protein